MPTEITFSPQDISEMTFSANDIGGDVRSQIAARQANPPAAATGDPRARPQSTLEEYAPFIAHPIETAKGFGGALAGGVKALAHPIDAVKGDWKARGEAYDRIAARGVGSDDPENLRDAVEMSIPFVGPAFAGAGRQMNSQDPSQRAQGTGAAIALTSGPEMVKGAVRGAIPVREAQIAKYQEILDPKGTNPVVAKELATRLLDEGQVLTDPKTQVTAIQEGRVATADKGVNQAIDALPPDAVKLADVNANIDAGKASASQTFGPNTSATLRTVGKYQKELVNNAVGNVATKTDVIPPTTARAARQAFDKAPYENGSTTAAADAQKVIGDAYRKELNKDPGVKAANETFQREKAGKDLAEGLPATKPILGGKSVGRYIGEGVASNLVHAMHPKAGAILASLVGGAEVVKVARDVMSSPGYKTWNAVQKAKFAKAVYSSDLPTVAEMTAQAGVVLKSGMDEQKLSKVLAGQ